MAEYEFSVPETCLQVSRYPQDDGSGLFVVEILFTDGTWDQLHATRGIAEAWKHAGWEAGQRKIPLLPDSLWPNRSPHGPVENA